MNLTNNTRRQPFAFFIESKEGAVLSSAAERGSKWLRTLLASFFCFFLGLAACTSVSQTGTSQSFEGSWVVVESEREMRPHEEMEGASVVFNADNTFAIQRLQRTPWSGTYSVNPDTGTIDLTFRGRGLVPPTDGTVWEGIYRFSPDGSLEINTAQGFDARPVDFLTGYDLTLMKLRRTN